MVSSTKDHDEELRLIIDANYVVFLFGIVILTIVNSVLWLLLRQPEEKTALLVINLFLSVFLLLDAAVAFYRRSARLYYFGRQFGWLLFLGSLPLPFAGVLRLVYLWRNVGQLRHSDVIDMRNVIVRKRASTTLLSVTLVAIIVFEAAILLVLSAERGAADANIRTAGDAIWWAIVTVATVGYGDQFPVTQVGRGVGIALIVVGVGLFSSITSFLADWFRRPRRGRHVALIEPSQQDAATLVKGLRQTVQEQEKRHAADMAAIQEQLDMLEHQLRQKRNADDHSQR